MLAGGAGPQIVGFPLPGMIKIPIRYWAQNRQTLLELLTQRMYQVMWCICRMMVGVVPLPTTTWKFGNRSRLDQYSELYHFGCHRNSGKSFDSVLHLLDLEMWHSPNRTKIDMIGGVISYAANYRNFGGHNSWLVTFNVDVDGNDTSGIRWVELRNSESVLGPCSKKVPMHLQMGIAVLWVVLPWMPKEISEWFQHCQWHVASRNPLHRALWWRSFWTNDGCGNHHCRQDRRTDLYQPFRDYSHLTMDPNNFTFWHTAEYFAITTVGGPASVP